MFLYKGRRRLLAADQSYLHPVSYTHLVEIFTTGRNAWQKSDSWPLKGAKPTFYYLRSRGRANTSYGEGLLSTKKVTEKEQSDTYHYDPAYPVPNIDLSLIHI